MSHSSNLSLSTCAERPDRTIRSSFKTTAPPYRCHIPQISLSLPVRSKQTRKDAPYIHLQVSHSSNLSLSTCAEQADQTIRSSFKTTAPPYRCHIPQISLSLPVRSKQTGQYAPPLRPQLHPTGVTLLKSLSLYLCGATRPDNTLRPHPPTGVTFLKSLSLYLCGATRPDNTLPTSTYRCHIPQISLSLPVRSKQTGQYAPPLRPQLHPTGVTFLKSLSLYLCGASRPDKAQMHASNIVHILNTSLPSLFATL